ncbi:MAG: D-glycerate 3-kinase [Oleispira sp.]|jgi:D-glycerate 3-kinase
MDPALTPYNTITNNGFEVLMGAKRGFITRNSLPEYYLQQASIWFDPIVETLIEHHYSAGRTLLVGINGCQGSGKTTLADYLCTCLQARGLRSIAISIDDFYLTRQQRQQLARDVHPLLSTRGVPGTHDLELALETLRQLSQNSGDVKVPKFNKAQDDRLPKEEWPYVETPIDIIILEGWCVGITAEAEGALLEPVNELESLKDPQGKWRSYINQQLVTNYPELWQLIDRLIMLQAPSFSCVYQWRLEQEQKLAQEQAHKQGQISAPDEALKEEALKKGLLKNNHIMQAEEIQHFIQHYERLTRHSLKYLPKNCQHLFQLTNKRQVVVYQAPNPLPGDPRFGQHNVTLKGL